MSGKSFCIRRSFRACGPVVQLVRMPACHAGGRGFEPLPDRHLLLERAGVAQLAEQLICNQQVAGSSPIASSINSDMVRFPSGQREQTVNLPSLTSMVRIHPSPPNRAGQRYIDRLSFSCWVMAPVYNRYSLSLRL